MNESTGTAASSTEESASSINQNNNTNNSSVPLANLPQQSEKDFEESSPKVSKKRVVEFFIDAQKNSQSRETSELRDKEEKEEKKSKDKELKDPLLEYILKPTQSTILVFCFKYKTIDKRTKLAKTIDKNALLFESKKIYDNQLPDWINGYILSLGFRVNPKAAVLMAEYLGNDLSKISNEISKLILSLKPGDEISAVMVEDNIGISKEFNIFELQSALGKRNIFKANQIINYFASNTKSNPSVVTTSQLYSYFLKVLQFHQVDHRSGETPAAVLGVHPYFVKDYEAAARAYSLDTCIRNISFIREFDIKTKGINNATSNDGQLLKELVYKILH